MNHGGKRQGAGRKPLAERTVKKTVSLLESDYTYLLTISEDLSQAIRQILAATRKE